MTKMTEAHAAFAAVVGKIEACDPSPARSVALSLAHAHGPANTLELGGPHCARCRTAWPCNEIEETADLLGLVLHDIAPRVSYPQPPADARVVTERGSTLAYTIPGEAHYAHVLSDADKRSLHVGASHPGGGGEWGFTVWENDLDGPTIQLGIYDDAFAAFRDIPDFFAALTAEKPSTLAGVIAILERIGAWDETARLR